MSLARLALPLAVAIAVLLPCLAPREGAPTETMPARDLVALAQRAGGASYSFDQATAEALASSPVLRPPEGASLAELEARLQGAGFRLRAVGPRERPSFRIERADG
jgi:hypothetical protein